MTATSKKLVVVTSCLSENIDTLVQRLGKLTKPLCGSVSITLHGLVRYQRAYCQKGTYPHIYTLNATKWWACRETLSTTHKSKNKGNKRGPFAEAARSVGWLSVGCERRRRSRLLVEERNSEALHISNKDGQFLVWVRAG